MRSALSSSADENTKKFANNLDLLIGSEQRQLYSRVDEQCIKNVIEDFPLVNDEGTLEIERRRKIFNFSSIEKF